MDKTELEKTELETIELEKTELEKKAVWWSGAKRSQIFNLISLGKSVQEVCELTSSRAHSIQSIVYHPYFLVKLEAYLKDILFHHQTSRILALDEVFQLYWDVIMGRKTVDGLTVDQASKHFTKLMDLKDKDPTVINPQQFNIIMNILKTTPKEGTDLPQDFGFKDLQIPKHEGPEEHPQLDKGEKDQNEQGSGN